MASKKLTPPVGAHIVGPRSTPAAPGLNVRISKPRLTKPIAVGGIELDAGGKSSGGSSGNRNFFQNLLAVPTSAISAVGKGIAGIPTFVGKTVQTGGGLVEGAVDLTTNLVDSDLYTSRIEQDLAKGRELGLSGEELVSYATQRQLPLVGAVVPSLMNTAERATELATVGLLDYNEPGFDYAKAFGEGRLGELIVEDLGNTILLGRLTGAGNIMARAGATIPGRTGRVVSTTGRFLEEPIATTVRGAAGAAAPLAAQSARFGRIAPSLGRISEADAPLRQMATDLGGAYRSFNEQRVSRLDLEIAGKIRDRDAAQASGNTALAQNIESEIGLLDRKRQAAMSGAGIFALGRRITKRGTIAAERSRQQVIQQFNRLVERGAAPESVETYRARATRLRDEAQRAPTQPQAEDLLRQADANDRIADLKEQYPDEMNQPLPDTATEAAIHVGTRKAVALLQRQELGDTPEQLVRAATDPMVGPSLAESGMQPTVEGVLAAIEYVKAKRGFPSQLNAAQVFQIDSMLSLLNQFNELITDAMKRGKGMPEGPAPFYWFTNFPVPSYILKALELNPNKDVAQLLDQAVVDVLTYGQRAGAFPETIFDDLGIDPMTPNGAFQKMVKQGEKEIGQNNPEPLPYMVAYYAVQSAFPAIRAQVPDFLLNPDIYPARMRPLITTQRQALRRVTGEDVLQIADQLATIARDYADFIDTNVLNAIAGDVRRALEPTERVTKNTWQKINGRLQTIAERAAKRRTALEAQRKKLSQDQLNEIRQLIEAEQALGAIQATLADIAADPTRLVGETPEAARLRTIQENRQRLGTRQTVLRNIAESRRTRFYRPTPEGDVTPSGARLSLVGTQPGRKVVIRRRRNVRKELNHLTAVIRGMDAAVTRKANSAERMRIDIAELKAIVKLVEETSDADLPFVIGEFSEQLERAQDIYGPPKETRTAEEMMFEGRYGGERFPEYYLQIIEGFRDLDGLKARIAEMETQYVELRKQADVAAAELPAREAEVLAERERVAAEGRDLTLDTKGQIDLAIEKLKTYLDEMEGADRSVLESQIAALENLSRLYRRNLAVDDLQGIIGLLQQQINKLDRALPAAARAAGEAQIRGVRKKLRGVAVVDRVNLPDQPSRAVPRLNRTQERRAQAQIARLNRQQAKTAEQARETRARLRVQDELQTEAEAVMAQPSARLSMLEEKIGPELLAPGEAPIYLPAGPARRMRRGRDIEMMVRGEGAAPQSQLQAAQQRISGAFVLTASGMAARINEVLGQLYRNTTVEEILTNPDLTKRAKDFYTPEEYDQLVQEVEASVAAQGIDRTRPEFDQQVAETLGDRILADLERLGYEVVSPVKVDPITGTHAAVGDLTTSVTPNVVDGESFVMRKGVAQRLFSEFERKGARQIPFALERLLDGVGNLTSRWKSHILPISIRWQVGDAAGIVLFAWVRGDIPPTQMAARIREVVARMTDPNDPRLSAVLFSDLVGLPFADPVLAAGFGAGLQGRGLKMEEIQFLEQEFARITGQRADIGRFVTYDKLRAKAFRLNEAINSIGRAAVYLENLDRILREQGRSLDEITGPNSINDPVITKAIEEAVDAANNTLGSFSDLTPWEKQVMRQIFPFWSWIKFINKAAYELAIDNPDRVLFYAHLGSMVTDPDDSGLADWLRGKTPVMGTLVDLSFLNPYSDGLLFGGNPLADASETFTSISPAIETPRKILSEIVYSQTGREYPFLQPVSRPGYLEGRPESNTRGFGDVLGGAAYLGIKGLVPIARNIFDILPTGTIPGTDIATGPVQRFGQGSLRTTGAYAEPRLSPLTGRVGGLLRTFGIPAPLISQETARRQAAEQRQRDEAARRRRIVERQRAGG